MTQNYPNLIEIGMKPDNIDEVDGRALKLTVTIASASGRRYRLDQNASFLICKTQNAILC
jgi:hypothetical protein